MVLRRTGAPLQVRTPPTTHSLAYNHLTGTGLLMAGQSLISAIHSLNILLGTSFNTLSVLSPVMNQILRHYNRT